MYLLGHEKSPAIAGLFGCYHRKLHAHTGVDAAIFLAGIFTFEQGSVHFTKAQAKVETKHLWVAATQNVLHKARSLRMCVVFACAEDILRSSGWLRDEVI